MGVPFEHVCLFIGVAVTSIPAGDDQHRAYYDEPAFSPWLIRLPILFISGGILLLLVLAILVGAYQIAFRERIFLGVSAMGVSLSGMTPDEARQALEQHFTYADQAVFTFRDGDRFWQTSARELGVSFDAETLVAEAYVAGRSANPMLDIIDQTLMWLNGKTLAPVVRYDQNLAVAQLEAIAREINREPLDATLAISDTNVEATPGQTGRTVDIAASLRRLDDRIISLSPGGEIPLVVNESPPVAWDAEAAARKARIAISAPVTLVATDADGRPLGPWTATPEQIARLLRVETVQNGDGTYSYDVTVNAEPFRAYLEALSQGLIANARDARFHFNESTGQLELFEPAINGRTLNVPLTLARMEQAIFDPTNRTVGMQFDEEQPRYHNNVTAADLGITELISQGTSYYTGSSRARIDNIILSATRFDGLIIAPGEQFSFNHYVGDITPEAGFAEGFVIFGGRTITGIGGGVCQVSTTAFRAAFNAGYPIEEWHPHGYRVGYYEQGGEGPGMDAAMYIPAEGETGELDFRFRNDTPYHLLIETSVYPANNSVQFRFYSTNPGRRVVKEGPQISHVQPPLPTRYEASDDLAPGQERYADWAAEGAEVRVTRRILDESGTQVRNETFHSVYQPWGAIIQVAPGDPRANS